VNAPGEEILYRFLDHVPNPDTFVVVSCPGLPRAIIGAQTLIGAQVPNRAAFLEDGTAGWTRATLELTSGSEKRQSVSRCDCLWRKAWARASQTSTRQDGEQRVVQDWLADNTKRTTYLLDIR
jgi:hypothetical protein